MRILISVQPHEDFAVTQLCTVLDINLGKISRNGDSDGNSYHDAALICTLIPTCDSRYYLQTVVRLQLYDTVQRHTP